MFWPKVLKSAVIIFVTGIFMYACVEPFEPGLASHDRDILIFEGYINSGPGKTRINVSRVSALGKSPEIRYENEAEVYIESDATESFQLNRTADGKYESAELNLPSEKKYRLYVKLQNGKEYRSEFLPVKVTPAIDSVFWKAGPEYIGFYVTTHDPQNTSRFYQWTFNQDWELRVPYSTLWYYDGDTIRDRPVEEYSAMQTCWGKNTSEALEFATSQELMQDQMTHQLQLIEYGSEFIRYKYAMQVIQHTLTEQEYNYLKLVQKNSTQLGSFFDPMPSQLYGNIKNIANADETVIGYIGAYTTQNLRLIVNGADFPPTPVQEPCDTLTFFYTKENLDRYLGTSTPVYLINDLNYKTIKLNPLTLQVVSIFGVRRYCADCRLKGGTVRPDFFD